MPSKQRIAITAAAVFVLLLVPLPYLASPEWTITVTDEMGHPMSGMLVRLNYQNYSVENNSHEQDLYTDANGQVVFPTRKKAASTLSRCYYTAMSAMAFVHASFGSSAYVNVFGRGREGSIISDGVMYFWTGHPDHLSSIIVARPLNR